MDERWIWHELYYVAAIGNSYVNTVIKLYPLDKLGKLTEKITVKYNAFNFNPKKICCCLYKKSVIRHTQNQRNYNLKIQY